MTGIPHRYLTADIPGVGGRLKEELADFVVEEVPLYHPVDHGEHTFFEVEKIDLSTLEALERMSVHLSVSPGEFGFAGLKDRKAITRQWFSVRRVPPEKVLSLRLNRLTVLWARLHANKLRVGHLRGNRFRIRLRSVEADPERVGRIIEALERVGVPNFYGPQRFGTRGDAFLIGRAMLRRDYDAALRWLLGNPQPTERNPHVVEARRRYMAGDLAGALEEFPRSYRPERHCLESLLRSRGHQKGAIHRLSEPVKRLYFSAYQSYLFNRVLERRLEASGNHPGLLYQGDLAWIHRNGVVFRVEDPAREEPRARAFEISPSGPIFGKKMPLPQGLEAELEADLLREEGVTASLFHQLMPGLHMQGGRRPLRVPLRELSWRFEGSDLCLEFFLHKGSYATTFLREIMKTDEVPCLEEPAESPVPAALPAAGAAEGTSRAGEAGERPAGQLELEGDDEPPLEEGEGW